MYKNQLQELAQRSCFNLPSYTCIREGPDHAPRFKSTVNFNGETFESPHYFSTLRQAEHAAAEVALNYLSNRGPSHSLAARILDETGVYKNLLQEIAQRVGAPLPQYTTFRSGLGHQPIFTGMVELAGITFTGETAKNKKQAEKNAAMAAWASLKQLAQQDATSSSETENIDELEQIKIARALLNYRSKEKMGMPNSSISPIPFEKKFQILNPRPSSPQPRPVTSSKILPFIYQKTAPRTRATCLTPSDYPESRLIRPQRFPAAGAAPYVPVRHCRNQNIKNMKFIWVVGFALFLGIGFFNGAANGAGECGKSSPDNEALKLAPCASAANDASATPTSSCCAQVKKMGQNPSCLCAVMLSNTAKASGIKPEVVMTIPKRCNIADRPVGYQCGGYTLP